MPRKVVFVINDLGLSGAPLYMEAIIKRLKDVDNDVDITVIANYDGIIENNLLNYCSVYVLNRYHLPLAKLNFLRNKLMKLRLNISFKYTYYENAFFQTSCVLDFAPKIKATIKTAFILEDTNMFNKCTELFKAHDKYMSYFSVVIGTNPVIVSFLNNKFGVQAKLVEGFYSEKFNNKLSEKVFKDNGVFQVGSVGSPTHRKGFDVFLDVALLVVQACCKINFVWLGFTNQKEIDELYNSILYGYNERIILLMASSNPQDIYLKNDVLFLCSREDPFPHVVIEHAMLGIPTLSMPSGNGHIDIIKSYNTGFLLESNNKHQIVSFIKELCNNIDDLKERGENSFKYYSKYSEKAQCDKIINFAGLLGLPNYNNFTKI